MRVFSYVIVRDRGGAPNFEPPRPTLAVCKPKIRLKADKGDLVLAFTGRSLGPEPHAVRWAGIVGERLTYEDYWNDARFAAKKHGVARHPDNIYRPNGSGFERVPQGTHGRPPCSGRAPTRACCRTCRRSWHAATTSTSSTTCPAL